MSTPGFQKITLSFDINLYEKLITSVDFECVAKGRIGNHLVKIEEKGVPIVRTTTAYHIAAQNFSSIHDFIIEHINFAIKDSELNNLPPVDFNNALIEVYDFNYSKMNYHSDQGLDLDANSYIGLFSCYKNPEELSDNQLRKLIVKEKGSDEELEIPLTHNSLILFSVETNSKFLHKIILDRMFHQKTLQSDNKWLGITFRKSKTFIQFEDNLPYFANGQLLESASEEQKAEFFKLRGQENRLINFDYPELTYTLSIADRLMPINKI
ncbi:hypothetical protein G7074_24090 [Pedobacter sp. HDW13]|uniref:alpha-ketoglutarate-dependent dioxygenase AlkB n=1 Tax=unclassified Pedobacter TaxID=2628915 RepID=UPI000F5AE362|nr:MULTISPECIES: alpha-ketoglutarate-dependent dioxygenase AlkB [unclassified Pedobacter]QIL42075.1 hypothetical protein G7074_24090 [Pedobacter sp. HDW13]RQO76692.1 hypothetical protein DBR40_12450 [Pedobacter sp. KBW01]